MKKRNVGERAETYFDSIDLQILEKLNTAQNVNGNPEGFGILELANALNIKHKNLKPHIDKLRKLDLIFAYKNSDNKLYLWTGKANVFYHLENDLSLITENPEEEQKLQRELNKKEALLEYLKKVRELSIAEEVQKAIETDFRKIKSKLPLQVDYKKELKRLKKNEAIIEEVIKESKFLKKIRNKTSRNSSETTKPKRKQHKYGKEYT